MTNRQPKDLPSWFKAAKEQRYWILLFSLFGMYLIEPLFYFDLFIKNTIDTVFLIFLMLSVFVISESKKSRSLSFILAIGLIAGHFLEMVFENERAILLGTIACGILFFAHLVTTIGKEVFTSKNVNLNTISGSICIYILLSVIWTFLYDLVLIVDPHAFSFNLDSVHPHANFSYFSLVTLTTLGFGDITPVAPIAQSLTVLEALLGQIYLTVLVARLVGLHLSQQQS